MSIFVNQAFTKPKNNLKIQIDLSIFLQGGGVLHHLCNIWVCFSNKGMWTVARLSKSETATLIILTLFVKHFSINSVFKSALHGKKGDKK